MKRVQPRTVLIATWLFMLAYAYPGYMNWDSGDQLWLARGLAGPWSDWHPPIMVGYWHLIEYVIHGPFGMFVLQTTLFLWGLYAAFCQRFSPRTAAWAAAALFLFPPVFTPMAAVWKDAQMAGFLLAGLMLALRRSWWWRGLGLALLLLGAGVRDNGAAALPPLCLLIIAAWGERRRLVTIVAAIGLFVAITAGQALLNNALTRARAYAWYKSVAIEDLAGTVCYEDPMTDDQVRAFLKGIPLIPTSHLQHSMCDAWNPRAWFPLSFGDLRIFDQQPKKAERMARRDAWKRAITEHPAAFFSARWAVMKEVLGLTDSQPWEPVCQSIAANTDQLRRVGHDHTLSWFQTWYGHFIWKHVSFTVLFRPWAYALMALILLGYAWRRRDGWIAALVGSGLVYEASYFMGAAAPDFRYSHWMIACTLIAAATVFGERLQRGVMRVPRQDPE